MRDVDAVPGGGCSDAILTANEAAQLLRVSRSKLYELVARHDVPHVRFSQRCLRFRRAALLAWIEQREQGGAK